MRYGLPYKGSKNSIARWIVEQLPAGDVLIDAFCGGGAVTHAALLSGKWKTYVMNDIDGRLPKLFRECIDGKYTVDNHPEWISREEFFRRKDGKDTESAYIALVWSFGNNGRDYIYGADIEQFKHDYHRAVYTDDTALLEPYGYKVTSSHNPDVYERYLEFDRQIKQVVAMQLENITRQIEIERLQSLQSLQSLQLHCMDYSELSRVFGKIEGKITLYCDIPYESTNCGKYGGFDHDRFYKWAREQDNIYISSYAMPDDFIELNRIKKTVLSGSHGNDSYALEKLFTNERTFDAMNEDQKIMRKLNLAEQLTFDILQKP